MKQKFFLISVVAGILAFTACEKEATQEVIQPEEQMVKLTDPASAEIIPGQYVVVLNDDATKFKSASDASYSERVNEVKAFAESMVKTKSSGFEIKNAYAEAIRGFSVKMSEEDVIHLEKDVRVKYVLPDRLFIRGRGPGGGGGNVDDPVQEDQVVPYGITRVGYGSGVGKVAWIIDTGVDVDHPDLSVDAARGYDFINGDAIADDDNGHGTHCAGTVAGIDNEIGVVGVAAGATIVPVKVLDRRGSGAYSVIIAGVDFVAANANPGDAANMSLGGGVYQAIDDAVYAASQNGIFFALAAGNESDDANNHSPARVNGEYIWTVSAMDENDYFASFSNYGNPPVDYCEPGVYIYSCAPGGGYATMSGTSMAAPHMCGILLMTNGNPHTDGYVNGDPDGNPDPIGHI
ncbi:MAG: S8 family serine peptidase [Bacteroidales bacterium]|jgi:subtilisin family serine protease|nr:S8 family serine peptidase [Bacteroidales bacterium]